MVVQLQYFHFYFYILVIYVMTFCGGEMCMFQNLRADCRWRIDGVAMAHITAVVNTCNDPVDVTFNVKTDNPKVDWSHTYHSAVEIYPIPGFDKDIRLQVKLRMIEKKLLELEADFYIDGKERTDFMFEEVKLTHKDPCVELNQAGKIAIGVLGCFVVIIGTSLSILFFVRTKRRKAILRNRMLINNAVPPSQTSPPPYTSSALDQTSPPSYAVAMGDGNVRVTVQDETEAPISGSISLNTQGAAFSQKI